jgi:peroxiredoxin
MRAFSNNGPVESFRAFTLSTLALLVFLLVGTAALPAKQPALKVGAIAPAWNGLPGVDGQEHGLEEFRDADAVAVVFTCNECPFAQGCESRLARLADAYRDRGVVVVAINSNKTEDLAAMQRRARERKLPYLYLRDETQNVAKTYGALRTPEVFLLDQDRKVAYRGGVDDAAAPGGEPQVQYLRDAIDAVLERKAPPRAVTRAIGCSITWK